ncbi:hypothetical protein FOA52_007373 [Chlamydomonas sp. UWO 241]|nr:hypothetical protein FOA52_007373 [Chlamydomonas sp. UWO 241]
MRGRRGCSQALVLKQALVLFCTTLVCLTVPGAAVKITIAPGRTDCFTESVDASHFQVPGGPRIDGRVLVSGNSQYYVPFVTVKVLGPQGNLLWNSEHVYNEAHFNVAAHGPGRYQVCFFNPYDSRTEAIIDLVYFTLAHLRSGSKPGGVVVPRGTEEDRGKEVAHADHMQEVEKTVRGMTEFLQVIMGSQRYLQRKLDHHMATMQSSNQRTLGYALLEVAILLSLVVFQILAITKFFERVGGSSNPLSKLNV